MEEETIDRPPEEAAPGPAAEAAPETAPEALPGDSAGTPPGSAPGEEEPAAGSAPETEPDELAACKDRLLRLQADFDNYRKRQARERAEWIRQANSDLLEALLPVLDQTDRAFEALEKDASEATKPYLEGFRLVQRTLLGAVAKFGLEPLPSPVGKPLDTDSAEAVSTLPPADGAKPGDVLFEIRKGYALGGKVLRAAQVVVAGEGS